MKAQEAKGFTLVEIMIVVVIIGILAILSIPVFSGIREKSQNTRFFSDCRTFAAAAEIWMVESGEEPPDGSSGTIPVSLVGYLRGSNWGNDPTLGGDWDFENEYGYGGVGTHNFSVLQQQIDRLDDEFDDGDLSDGLIRQEGNRVYYVYADPI